MHYLTQVFNCFFIQYTQVFCSAEILHKFESECFQVVNGNFHCIITCYSTCGINEKPKSLFVCAWLLIVIVIGNIQNACIIELQCC